MDNQTAINFLDQLRKVLLDDKSWLKSTTQPINEAFDMAISALQAQDLQPTCNNLATDAISRQAAIDAIVAWAKDTNEMPDGDDCIMIIGDLPSAQPEIIYCGECAKMKVDTVFHDCWCGETGKKVWVNHYCGYAERRTDEDD